MSDPRDTPEVKAWLAECERLIRLNLLASEDPTDRKVGAAEWTLTIRPVVTPSPEEVAASIGAKVVNK